jgi:hypothetical protein
VYSWDVVNEPFNGDGSFVGDVFYRAMGSGYIADALRTAHAADPGAQLYLNDYGIEGENAKSNAMYSLVQSQNRPDRSSVLVAMAAQTDERSWSRRVTGPAGSPPPGTGAPGATFRWR